MLVAGIMSGTSVDGIDVALVEVTGTRLAIEIKVVGFHDIPFPDGVRDEVLDVSDSVVATSRVSQLHFLLGKLFGTAVVEACERSDIGTSDLDLIGCHGQTIYHQADASDLCGFEVCSTLQIGEAASIARAAGVPVISDFRTADIAAGGHGAPLVPFADYLLFRDSKINRVALNIGGIANVTAIPAGRGIDTVVAFDTGPGNMVIDGIVGITTGGKKRFDRDGQMAAAGSVDEDVLDELLEDPYFALPAPKSTGREKFGEQFAAGLLERGLEPEAAVATATQLTVRSVLSAIERFVEPVMPVDELVVAGGGWRNPRIIEPIRASLPEARVRATDEVGISSDAKEAVAFAILAYETYHGRPSNVPSATGSVPSCRGWETSPQPPSDQRWIVYVPWISES